ncbi:unnamed protein product [Phytomonas sp. Hart1]|nr:unnamed protein product [Phytomonas sp. Hart1]|eukprot:CCW71948.1 unnamed protein product [Phytomonas sp. isolate Hart1]
MLRCGWILRTIPLAVTLQHYGDNFTVSSRAWHRISEKNQEEGLPNDKRYLRLAIDSGGCHGYLYKFSLETIDALNNEEDLLLKETDVVSQDDPNFSGADPPPQLVVDNISISKLQKAVIDYYSELKGAAFVVVGNELVDQSCACALSFSLKPKSKSASAVAARTNNNAHVGTNTKQRVTAVQDGTDDLIQPTKSNIARHRAIQR